MWRARKGWGRGLVLLGVAVTTGCYSWKVESVPPAQFVEDRHPGRIRLTLQGGDRIDLKSPHLSGDTIVGKFHNESPPPAYIWRPPGVGMPPEGARPPRKGVARVPVSDATGIESHHFEPLQTLGVSVIFVAVWVGLFITWFLLY